MIYTNNNTNIVNILASVWSSLLTVNTTALGTFVSLTNVTLKFNY